MDARLEAKLGFDKVREAIQGRCSTDYAALRVAEEEFSTDAAEIHRRHLLADEMRLILMFEDNFPTSGYIDAIPFLEPIGKSSSIDLLSLGKLRTLLDTLRRALHFFHTVKEGIYPNLQHLAAGVNAPAEVMQRIDAILDRHGEIKDTASDELYKIRKSIKEKEINVSRRMNAILRQAQQDGLVEADASVSIRDGKMLIPVSSAKKRQFQGFMYDESATGKTAFMEPAEIVSLQNDIAQLHFDETREIARILYEFAEFLRPFVPELIAGATFVGELDFNMAKAQVALDYIAGMPVVSTDGSLSLRKARHPLLEKSLRKEKKEIVPLTVTLTPEKRILLISGPNAGGKSVCMKTVGLLQYLFQWGMLIPTSETSELPVFDRIMVSIGDDQSLENDLSTYSSFLTDMKAMLSVADGRTLILIDEFGSGTEPAAGGAIAEAILHELDTRGAYGVITTHYTNLKLYASSAETGVVNGAMQFDASTVAPLFVGGGRGRAGLVAGHLRGVQEHLALQLLVQFVVLVVVDPAGVVRFFLPESTDAVGSTARALGHQQTAHGDDVGPLLGTAEFSGVHGKDAAGKVIQSNHSFSLLLAYSAPSGFQREGIHVAEPGIRAFGEGAGSQHLEIDAAARVGSSRGGDQFALIGGLAAGQVTVGAKGGCQVAHAEAVHMGAVRADQGEGILHTGGNGQAKGVAAHLVGIAGHGVGDLVHVVGVRSIQDVGSLTGLHDPGVGIFDGGIAFVIDKAHPLAQETGAADFVRGGRILELPGDVGHAVEFVVADPHFKGGIRDISHAFSTP